MTWKEEMVRVLQVGSGLSSAFTEIQKGSPRAAAIVSAALVEDKLEGALKAWLHQDVKLHEKVFGASSGVLGSFGAQIDAAFLVGLCSVKARDELKIIAKVRNKFAHDVSINKFDLESDS